MKQFFNRNKILIGSLVFLIVYSLALVSFATPPGSEYTPGETLDPSCVPGSSNCTVNIGLSIGDTVTGSNFSSVLFIDPATGLLNEDNGSFIYDNSNGTLYAGNFTFSNGESSTSGIMNFVTERLHSYGTSNEFWGVSAGNFTLTGSNNIGLGTNSGTALTSGSGNVCIGQQTCQVLTTGGSNIFLGKKTGESHSSGDRNILIGYDLDSPAGTTASDTLNIGDKIFGDLASGYIGINDSTPSFALDVTGTINSSNQYDINGSFFGTQNTSLSNVRLGSGSGASITSGTSNILLGINSGTAITTSSNNTIIGTNAGISLTNSSGSNVFIGDQAGYNQTTGYENTFIGQIAGRANLSGQRSVAIGNSASYQGTSADRYVAIGYAALGSQIGAADNVAIGYSAGVSTTGGTNVFIGSSAGYLMTSAQYNVMLGYSADLLDKTDSNNFVVGSSYAPIYDTYIGGGEVNTSPLAITYHGTGGSGTNIAGGDFVLASGKATGNASGGSILFQTSDAGASGTTLQSLTTKATLLSNGNFGIGVSPSARLHIKGSGNTSGTASFFVTNSDNIYNVIQVRDDLAWSIGTHYCAGPGQSTYSTGVSINSYLGGSGGIGISGCIAAGIGATAIGANVNGTYAVGLGGYGTSVTGEGSVGIGMFTTTSLAQQVMIGTNYAGSMANALQYSVALGTGYTGSYTGTNYAKPTVYFQRDSGMILPQYRTMATTDFDRLAGNAITSYIYNPRTSSISITSVSNDSNRAVFTFSSISANIQIGEEVTLSGFTQYTNGTYYVSYYSGLGIMVSSTRSGAFAGTGIVAYTATDTGSIAVHNRRPVNGFTDTVAYYPDDIAAGQASPHWLTEDGYILSLGSEFGTQSNNNLSLTANSTVGATLTTSGNFGIGTTSPTALFQVTSSGNNYLKIDPANQYSSIGWVTGGAYAYFDDTSATSQISAGTSIDISSPLITFSGGQGLNFNNSTHAYKIGDTNGSNSSTVLDLEDDAKLLKFSQNGKDYLNLDVNNQIYKIGDIDSAANNTRIIIDDGTKAIAMESPINNGKAFQFTNSDGTCDLDPGDVGGISCPSDITLKKDVTDLGSALDTILQLRPVTYRLKNEDENVMLSTGLIAQEVQLIYPKLVSNNANGTLALNYSGLIPFSIKAIQELDMKIEPLSDLLTEDNSIAEAIRIFLANSTNKITRIFTGEICLSEEGYDSECINREELHSLKQLLQNQGGTSGTTSGDSTTGGDNGGGENLPQDTTPPVITLMGEQSIQLTVGDTYTEQGATATDDTDGDVTANIIISGTVDTTTIGTYTVTYIVTDSAGNVSEATRVVVVE